MEEPDFLLFASDATLFALAAATSLGVAAVAWFAERRRMRRRQIDAVGCVPWTTLFVLALFGGVILAALAVTGWLRG